MAKEDINCKFPIEWLRELEDFIGELAPTAYSCMGRIFLRLDRLDMACFSLQLP